MIEVKNITKKYGNFVAVDDVSFEVKDNEIVGFLGPNGAGKSTTMNMITGYIEPTKGKIIINGYDISKSPKKAKKQIGYMPESVPLYNDLTVKEFITYMADLRRVKKDKKEKVEKIMEQTGLTKVKNKLIKNISRGYKQRVSLAGTLIGDPDVLILDEPTVGLDPKQITEIRALIKKLGKKHTVILSSHLLSEVSQICEKVIIINNGKIIAVDTPENLENKTKSDNDILVTVEDNDNKMKTIKDKIKGIKNIKKIRDNEDGTIQYIISAEKETDIRKSVFEVFQKENITIFELKKMENTLEDAFLQIINAKDDEIKKIETKQKEEQEKRKEELAKMNKKDRKIAIKEDKKKLKIEKEEEFEREWKKEKAIEKAEKDEKRKLKETRKQVKGKVKNNQNNTPKKEEKTNNKENDSKVETTKNKEENTNSNSNNQNKNNNENNENQNKVNNSNKNNNNQNKANNTNSNNTQNKNSNSENKNNTNSKNNNQNNYNKNQKINYNKNYNKRKNNQYKNKKKGGKK